MCGIVGAIAERDVTAILIEGLKRLEYRGYDSAGVAIIDTDNKLHRRRIKGKVAELVKLIKEEPVKGFAGIAHTRWATHGVPSEINAHPHVSNNEIAVVHNGIIENHDYLRERLKELGYPITSETDSELIAHIIHHFYQDHDLLTAVRKTTEELTGAFALGIIHAKEADRLIAYKCGSPLVIGLGIGENFIASDSLALLPVTQRFVYLEENQMAQVTREGYQVFAASGKKIKVKEHQSDLSAEAVTKGSYRHFMLKEIFEQPEAITQTLEGRISETKLLEAVFGVKAKEVFDQVKHVQIVACGTSYHAGLVTKYWLEEYANIATQVEVASEFRYRKVAVLNDTLFVTISQSGETADTIAALKQVKKQNNYLATLAICNVPESTLVRESDLVLMTRAGREIGVASTKAFTTQLSALLLLTIALGKRFGIDAKKEAELIKALHTLPQLTEKILSIDKQIAILANRFADKNHALFLGRGVHYPIALEGALKLKEISYIHAEAYPAGELKHGPLALVDEEMPVIAVAPNDELLEKLKSNLQEVKARGGELIVFADCDANMKNGNGLEIIVMPKVDKVTSPIVYTLPLQLLAYHVAVIKGTDIDQPRNLAKSVTVE